MFFHFHVEVEAGVFNYSRFFSVIFPLFFFSISRKYVPGRNLACFFIFTWRLKLECSTTVDFFQ